MGYGHSVRRLFVGEKHLMSDQGKWFKLWVTSIDDPDLDNLPIADFGRWAKLGTYIKAHGTNGSIIVSNPARSLCSKLQNDTFDDMIKVIEEMPNITVTLETNSPVSYTVKIDNWLKYQGDYSSDRVSKFRAKKRTVKRPKRRREEKRGEETRREENKEIYIKKVSSKRTTIPNNFMVSDLIRQWATEKFMPSPNESVDAFLDHHRSKGSMFVDWEAAFRTWLRNAKKFGIDKEGTSDEDMKKISQFQEDMKQSR